MTYGYLLSTENRNGTNFVYRPSEPFLNFYRNSGKNATLLILNQKVNEMAYDIEDRIFFEEMSNMSYLTSDLKIQEMKKSSSEILREQSIIAGVSNWESYFSDICEIIFNNDEFIKLIYSDKKKLKKFLKDFKLMQDFQIEFFLNGNKIDGLKFGSYIVENKKINFQDSDDTKKLFKSIFDIDLVRIEETGWTEITEFIKHRHEIIHNANNQDIVRNYSKDKIQSIIKSMSNIINKVDETLFTDHNAEGFQIR